MWTATLRGMLAHKLRVALTTASIALGVAFLAGTLMLTDTMQLAFTQLFGQVSSGTDAVVRTQSAYAATSGVGVSRSPIDAAVLDRVAAVDGVAAAEGDVRGYALITDTEGKAVLTSGGFPTMGYSMAADEELRGDVHLLSGRAPSGPDEVAIDATSASSHDIPLGADVKVLFRGPTRSFTVVGTVGYGDEQDLGGTTSAFFDVSTAQEVLGTPGTYDAIGLRSDGSVSDAELARRVAAVVPDGVEAVTGAAVAKEASDAINAQFSFVTVLFSVFAGIALFVGSFIIWNTFSMVVAQRSREIALLRAIGATRRQVRRNLLVEAVLLGVSASAVGVGLGAGVAKGLNSLMAALGFNLPSTSLQVRPATIAVSLAVGTVVTVLAALVPAHRATKVLPVEALRDSAPGAKAPSRVRAAIGGLLTAGGLAAVLLGLYGGSGGNVVLLGMAAALAGVITLAPLAARPLASVIGGPLRLRGVAGSLARQNAMRNPRRTAATATALMIGLTLVIAMSVFGSSLKASFGTILGDSTNAALFVTPASAQGGGFSPEVGRVVADVPGVAAATSTGWGEARFDGEPSSFSSVDPDTAAAALELGVTSGSVTDLGTDGLLVSGAIAASHGWAVGSTVPVEFAATGSVPLQVRGTFEADGYLDGDYIVSRATQEANNPGSLVASVLVVLEDGADVADVKAGISSALRDHPDAKVLDRRQYEQEMGGIVDKLLTLVSVMLLLAVVIALLGIVNTLALSVYERTRELGLLRAVGMTTAQVRAMVRWESVVISLIGALTGVALGVGVGLALAQSLEGDGIHEVAVPGVRIAVFVALAALAGVLAATGPARSASRVDVLRAVVTD
jgi:putative ABC transport system permease protein